MRSADNFSVNTARGDYLAANSTGAEAITGFRRDSSWVRQSFIAPYTENQDTKRRAMDIVDERNMTFSTAYFKYYDTSPGGSACINPVPSFTSFADIRVKGLMPGSQEFESIGYSARPIGPGRCHSEKFDDWMQVIHLRFGVPCHNSLTQFFTGFYNSSAASLARTGRFELSWTEKFLKFAAGVISLVLMPLAIIPVLFIFMGEAVRFMLRIPSSSFYYFKPTMPTYWLSVSNLFNQLAVNMGLVKYTAEKTYESFTGQPYNFSPDDHAILAQIFPDYTDRGVLDICGVAGRYKRIEAKHRKYILQQLKSPGNDGWYGKVRQAYEGGMGVQQVNATETLPSKNKSPMNRLFEWWDKAKEMSSFGMGGENETLVEKDLRASPDVSGMSVAEAEKTLKSPFVGPEKDSIFKYFIAEADDGSAYASFRVNPTGTASSSFSNTTGENSMKQKFNSASASARDLQINLAGGNVDPWGIAKSILDGVGTVLSTAADILQVSGLAAFAGNAFIDIPDNWESHSADVQEMNYTIDLVTPYNNKVSQMIDIYMPLCMLLAGCLPLATGKQSYQSPFICQVYDQGRCISRLAVMSSLRIERGIAHTAWSRDKLPNGIKVTVGFKDLSSIVAMPIQNGVSLWPLEGIMDGETKFTDLLMSWSGLSLRDVQDRGPILRRQLDTRIANYATAFSPSRVAMELGDSALGTLASVFMAGTNKK